jgi:hypothetical protein
LAQCREEQKSNAQKKSRECLWKLVANQIQRKKSSESQTTPIQPSTNISKDEETKMAKKVKKAVRKAKARKTVRRAKARKTVRKAVRKARVKKAVRKAKVRRAVRKTVRKAKARKAVRRVKRAKKVMAAATA